MQLLFLLGILESIVYLWRSYRGFWLIVPAVKVVHNFQEKKSSRYWREFFLGNACISEKYHLPLHCVIGTKGVFPAFGAAPFLKYSISSVG